MWILNLWLANMAFCCLIFNLLWAQTERARNFVEERDGPHPTLRARQTDKWNYWTMLFWSLTIFPIRFWVWVFLLTIATPIHFMIGDPEPGQPQTTIRR